MTRISASEITLKSERQNCCASLFWWSLRWICICVVDNLHVGRMTRERSHGVIPIIFDISIVINNRQWHRQIKSVLSLLHRLSTWRYPHLLLSAGAAPAARPQLSIDISCPQGAQQQTRRPLSLLSISRHETDRQNNNNNHLTAVCPWTTRVGRYQKKHSPAHAHPGQRTSFITFLH